MDNGHAIFDEYRSAAKWCAKRGYTGDVGDPLPNLLSGDCHAMINEDPEAFRDEVRLNAYALAGGDAMITFCHCPAPTAGPGTLTDYTGLPTLYRLCRDCGLPIRLSGVPEQFHMIQKRRAAIRDTTR